MCAKQLRITRPVSLDELKRRYRHEKDARVKIRIHMVMRAWEGASARQVAREHHISHTTVAPWVRRSNEDGFEGLSDKPRSGAPARITPQRLQKLLAKPPTHYGYQAPAWSPRLVRAFLEERYGVKYQLSSIYRVLKRCDFSLIVPRPRHYKQRPQKLRAFKKK